MMLFFDKIKRIEETAFYFIFYLKRLVIINTDPIATLTLFRIKKPMLEINKIYCIIIIIVMAFFLGLNRMTKKTFIIAEIAQNHEGSFNQCFAFIDAISKTKTSAIKFQTHIAKAESSSDEIWRKKFSHVDETRYDYWQRMEFSEDQWKQLKEYSNKKGLKFMSSPFSEEAVDLLIDVGVDAFKVGSGEVVSYGMLDKMIVTHKPIYISSGMSSWEEMDEYVGYLKDKKANFTLMQCTTSYPSKLSETGVGIVAKMKERYACAVGFSDHSGSIYPSLAAKNKGAEALEVHVTLSHHMFGPDISSSIDIEQLKELGEAVSILEKVNKSSNKNSFSVKSNHLRQIFYKRAVAKRDINVGEVVSANDFEFRKPRLDGISELEFREYLDFLLIKAIRKLEPLTLLHFSDDINAIVKKKTADKRNYYKERAQKK